MYKNQGCSKGVAIEDLKEHGQYCRYKTDWWCPMRHFKCDWKGRYHNIYKHITLKHKAQKAQPHDRVILNVLEKFITLPKSIIITCFCYRDEVFQIYVEKCVEHQTLEVTVMYCGPKEEWDRYLYKLKIWSKVSTKRYIGKCQPFDQWQKGQNSFELQMAYKTLQEFIQDKSYIMNIFIIDSQARKEYDEF